MKVSKYHIEDMIDSLGLDYDEVIRRDYPWEGPDRTCLGLVFDHEYQWEILLVELAVLAAEGDDPGFNIGDLRKAIERARKNSMGKGVIVYWPYGGLSIAD